MYVERHTKRQIRYYKSQLYKAFVISDVCNRSLCVIPCRGQDKTRQDNAGVSYNPMYIDFIQII